MVVRRGSAKSQACCQNAERAIVIVVDGFKIKVDLDLTAMEKFSAYRVSSGALSNAKFTCR